MSEDEQTNKVHHVVLHKASKPWYKRFWVWFGIVIILLVLAGAANGNNQPAVVNSSSNKISSTSRTSSSSSSTLGKVGDTIQIGGGSGLDVTLMKVIDPAQGADSFTAPDSGKRFVAVEMTVINEGSQAYNDDANNDVAVIGSDNQTYSPDFNSVSECTNFNDGEYALNSKESTTGCVTFQVPTSVNVAKVQFTNESADNSTTAEWDVQ